MCEQRNELTEANRKAQINLPRVHMQTTFTDPDGWLVPKPELKNKALGLAGQAEILIGHLYNLIQS